MHSGAPWINASSVAETDPSTEFSNGTTALRAAPERTCAIADSTVGTGTGSTSGPTTCRTACSVKVPLGPR